jgi:prepilin peptidase CpaA
MNWLTGLIIFVGVAASVEDLVRRRISNWIPACALAGGLTYHLVAAGWKGVASSLLAAAAGFFVFLIFYCLGGMGGGDVKLMAGFGALLGSAGRLMEAALWTAAVGALIALAWLGTSRLRVWIKGWQTSRNGEKPGTDEKSAESIPYAPAITIGAWLALLARS